MSFRSYNHDLFTIETNVTHAISNDDSKREIDDRISPLIYTVPWV